MNHPLTFLRFLLIVLALQGAVATRAQTMTWGNAGELVKTRTLGTIETDTGRTALFLEYREAAGPQPERILFLKNRRDTLQSALRVKGRSRAGEGGFPELQSGPPQVVQVLYQGKTAVPLLSTPANDHPWNVEADPEARRLTFRWREEKGYFAEWAWDDSLLCFLPAAFTEYIVPWYADSSALLHRRIFREVPVTLLKKVHGIDPPNFPDDWKATGYCMVRTRLWDDFHFNELHGHFNIRYANSRIAGKKPAGEAMTVEMEGTWMEGDIPYGPLRVEAWFDDQTVVRIMFRYADFDDPEHATGTVLWANASCVVRDKGEQKAYSIYLDEVRSPDLAVILRELRATHGASIPLLFVPEKQE